MQIQFVNYNHTLAAYMDDITLDTRLKLYLPEKPKLARECSEAVRAGFECGVA